MMTLESYLDELQVWHVRLRTILRLHDAAWYTTIVQPWFEDIAPRKAEEYGIECWLRLGARALVVDTNACYYRWKRLSEIGRTLDDPAMLNALRDGFGYAVMLAVVAEEDATWMSLVKIVKQSDPYVLNEQLIEEVWECGRLTGATERALGLAWAMYARST